MTQRHVIINKTEVTAGNRIKLTFGMYLLKCLTWVLLKLEHRKHHELKISNA